MNTDELNKKVLHDTLLESIQQMINSNEVTIKRKVLDEIVDDTVDVKDFGPCTARCDQTMGFDCGWVTYYLTQNNSQDVIDAIVGWGKATDAYDPYQLHLKVFTGHIQSTTIKSIEARYIAELLEKELGIDIGWRTVLD